MPRIGYNSSSVMPLVWRDESVYSVVELGLSILVITFRAHKFQISPAVTLCLLWGLGVPVFLSMPLPSQLSAVPAHLHHRGCHSPLSCPFPNRLLFATQCQACDEARGCLSFAGPASVFSSPLGPHGGEGYQCSFSSSLWQPNSAFYLCVGRWGRK